METVRASTADQLAQDFIAGSITESQWRESTLALLRKVHAQATALSVGGYAQVTPKMLLQIEQALAEDAVRMQGVNAQTPNLAGRVRLWVGNGRASYWRNQPLPPHNSRTQEVLERRLIKPGDQCQFCIDQAALGWQPLGVLSAPGTVPDPPPAQACYTNCRCTRDRKVVDKTKAVSWIGTKSADDRYRMVASNENHVLLQEGAWKSAPVYILWDRQQNEVIEVGDLSDLLDADVWTWRKFDSHMRTSKGGPGSGNFGHAGRPGLVGGSVPDSDNPLAEPDYPEIARGRAKVEDRVWQGMVGSPS